LDGKGYDPSGTCQQHSTHKKEKGRKSKGIVKIIKTLPLRRE
jgi:hypothetical protein